MTDDSVCHGGGLAIGGESAGSLELGLLSRKRAREYADMQFQRHHGIGVRDAIPRFNDNFMRAKQTLVHGGAKRADMPVLGPDDGAILAKFLKERGKHYCDECLISAGSLIPTQSQIYFDKSIDNTAAQGVKATLQYLQAPANHLWIAQIGTKVGPAHIIDGHHRWLSSDLINPEMMLPAFIFKSPYHWVITMAREYSDHANRARNS